jgi:histidyl-tRNA synthetase
MSNKVQSIRGMHDVLPETSPHWQYLEKTISDLLAGYGYSEIRMPIVEKTELFSRSIGEVTDIVEKEMYTFEDRNGDSLTLRPEGTAGCVRAAIENGLIHNQQQRLWYMGPMFRHERPQKGRYRQFHQVGVETFGIQGPDIDVELMAVTARLWEKLGLKDVRLEINSLGSLKARHAYRDILVEYFRGNLDVLDEESKRRLETNPLRILDTKNPNMAELVQNAPSLLDHLDPECAAHFETVQARLDALGIPFVVNPRLVRGLDYYSRSVFEWITESLGAQGTICAGGRYDGLIEQLGGRAGHAAGFAMGMERLIALLEEEGNLPDQPRPHGYVVTFGDEAEKAGLVLSEKLRSQLPGLRLINNCGGGGFKAQMKRADKSQADYALILGDDELANQSVSLKPLREEGAQQVTLNYDELTERLKQGIQS